MIRQTHSDLTACAHMHAHTHTHERVSEQEVIQGGPAALERPGGGPARRQPRAVTGAPARRPSPPPEPPPAHTQTHHHRHNVRARTRLNVRVQRMLEYADGEAWLYCDGQDLLFQLPPTLCSRLLLPSFRQQLPNTRPAASADITAAICRCCRSSTSGGRSGSQMAEKLAEFQRRDRRQSKRAHIRELLREKRHVMPAPPRSRYLPMPFRVCSERGTSSACSETLDNWNKYLTCKHMTACLPICGNHAEFSCHGARRLANFRLQCLFVCPGEFLDTFVRTANSEIR